LGDCPHRLGDCPQGSALYVFDMQDASRIPPIVESLFPGMNAEVRLSPVMNFQDLQKGLAESMKSR